MTVPIGGSGLGAGQDSNPDNNSDGLPDLNAIIGNGSPDNLLGSDGDFYIDRAGMLIHGPKLADVWPAGVSFQGAPGPQGPPGENGTNGIDGIDGAQGIQGVPGNDGAPSPAVAKVNICFASNRKEYVKGEEDFWERLAIFYFEGTDVLGIPSFAKLQFTNKGNINSDIRIIDVTNATTICQVDNAVPASEQVFEELDMGALSNLPTAKAVFELHARGSDGANSDETWIAALLMD